MPQAAILTRICWGPGLGTGTSIISTPGSGRVLAIAFITGCLQRLLIRPRPLFRQNSRVNHHRETGLIRFPRRYLSVILGGSEGSTRFSLPPTLGEIAAR